MLTPHVSNTPEPQQLVSHMTAKQLEYPDAPATDYNTRDVPADFAAITTKTVDSKVCMCACVRASS